MKHLIRTKGVALALALGLLAAACGGGDDGTVAEPPDDAGEDTAAEEGEEAADIAFDVGVTEEACPEAVNPDNGCIYLGIISDLTEGPFAPLAVPITDAQKAFWQRVNENGGIGGFDINVTRYTKDNKYNPEVHNQVYQEIKPHVLGLAQTLGSPTTAAIIDDLKANSIVSAPASWTSLWEFEDVIIESGNNYCVESMNALEWLSGEKDLSTVMAVAYPGDYGGDGAAGAKIYAEENGLEFSYVEQIPLGLGGTTQGAVQAIVQQNPDVVVVTTAPSELAEIVGGAAAQGYTGTFLGTSPTWNPALLQSPAKDALVALYFQSGPWQTFTTDTPGHQAMREALGDVTPNDGYTSGWAWSYPMKAALEKAVEMGDLTREGLLAAVESLETVDYEGMLPPEAGNFAGDPNAQAFRQTGISKPDPESQTGVTEVASFFEGETAKNYDFSEGACYQVVSLN